jgi:hypothetical protein
MEEVEEELSKAKQKVDWSLCEYLYDHNESDYSYLHDYTIIILQLPFPLLLTSSLSRCPVKRIIEQPTLGMIKNVKLLGNPLGMLLMSP